MNKSLFKELETYIRSEGDATSTYKVVSSAYEISLLEVIMLIRNNSEKNLQELEPQNKIINFKNFSKKRFLQRPN